ncbi:MAG: peptidoglycan editing factor PgeF [Alphaproteobacteria bacterium]
MAQTNPLIEAEFGNDIQAGFFGRSGGLSTGIYRSLNCGRGSDDDGAVVTHNRARVAQWFNAEEADLCGVHQIHSPTCVTAEKGQFPKADALVTDQPGLICAVLTADCVPVLFADPRAGVIGAAHAGWKGAQDGVLEATIEQMTKLGAKAANITAHIGPAIRQHSYEVGIDWAGHIIASDQGAESLFIPSPRDGHLMFDLPRWCLTKLQAAGVHDIVDCRRDTYREEDDLFSYRRSCHREEPDYGRNISAIMLQG